MVWKRRALAPEAVAHGVDGSQGRGSRNLFFMLSVVSVSIVVCGVDTSLTSWDSDETSVMLSVVSVSVVVCGFDTSLT